LFSSSSFIWKLKPLLVCDTPNHTHTHTYTHKKQTNNPTQFRKQKKSIFSRLFSSLGRTKSSSLHTKNKKTGIKTFLFYFDVLIVLVKSWLTWSTHPFTWLGKTKFWLEKTKIHTLFLLIFR
jgi:hypothetical protein